MLIGNLIPNCFDNKIIYFIPSGKLEQPQPETVDKCSTEARKAQITANMDRVCAQETKVSDLPNLDERQLRGLVQNILVDNDHKVLYCEVPKAGSTTLKFLLVKYSQIYKNAMLGDNRTDLMKSRKSVLGFNWAKFGIRSFNSYSKPEILSMLKYYTSVIGVRHPLARVHSVFKDKLHDRQSDCNRTGFYTDMGLEIMRKTRGPVGDNKKYCVRDLTFSEFATYSAQQSHEPLNDKHFKPFISICNPCAINYDHVFKLETGDSDQNKFVTEILKEDMGQKSVHLNERGSTSENKWEQNDYVEHIADYDGIDKSVVEYLKSYYAKDMELFGYSVSEKQQQYAMNCRAQHNGKYCC